MRKKHFERLAKALRKIHPGDMMCDELALWMWVESVHAIANACEGLSDTFDRARFIETCNKE